MWISETHSNACVSAVWNEELVFKGARDSRVRLVLLRLKEMRVIEVVLKKDGDRRGGSEVSGVVGDSGVFVKS